MTPEGITYRLEQLKRKLSFAIRGATELAKLRVQRNGHRPSVAAVIVGRNDDYMPDFADRLRATIEWNTQHLVSEVIFVEWNPPADRELLSITLTKQFKCVRAFVVSAKIHDSLCENPNLPLLEYHAKNIGIRRANSSWIIAMNADVALGPDTVRRLYHSLYDTSVAWTAQRVDIRWVEGRRDKFGLLDCLGHRRMIPYVELGTGDFILASRALWDNARGYDESLTKHRIGCDIRGAAQLVSHGGQIEKAGVILHLAHPTSCTEGVQLHHGDYAPLDGLPYQNGANWGLGNCQEIPVAERVWQLK